MRQMTRATDFEQRHQTLLHLMVVGAAFLTYAFQPDDIVWAFVKHHTIYRSLLERVVFGTGALMVLCSAALETWAHAYRFSSADTQRLVAKRSSPPLMDLVLFGRLLFALGIGLLAPISGTIILLAGEVGLVIRLFARSHSDATLDADASSSLAYGYFRFKGLSAHWWKAVRTEASKWGLAVTMMVFTFTLRDRIAEVLAGASFLLWFILNLADVLRPSESDGKI